MQEGSPLFTFHAYLPAEASYGFASFVIHVDLNSLSFFRAWHSILTLGFPSSRTFKKEGQRTQALMPKYWAERTYLLRQEGYL
jgi:hypothetical protein